MGIRTVYQPLVKIGEMLNLVKDVFDLRIPGVYCILCTCGDCCIGQMGHSILEKGKWPSCRLNDMSVGN